MTHPNSSIYAIAYFHTKPEHTEDCKQALSKLIAPTHAEPGCIQYTMLTDTEDQQLLIMLEQFKDQDAFDEHVAQPYVQDFMNNAMNQYCEKVYWHEAKKAE